MPQQSPLLAAGLTAAVVSTVLTFGTLSLADVSGSSSSSSIFGPSQMEWWKHGELGQAGMMKGMGQMVAPGMMYGRDQGTEQGMMQGFGQGMGNGFMGGMSGGTGFGGMTNGFSSWNRGSLWDLDEDEQEGEMLKKAAKQAKKTYEKLGRFVERMKLKISRRTEKLSGTTDEE